MSAAQARQFLGKMGSGYSTCVMITETMGMKLETAVLLRKQISLADSLEVAGRCGMALYRDAQASFPLARDALHTESARVAFKDYYAFLLTVVGDLGVPDAGERARMIWEAKFKKYETELDGKANRVRAEF